MKIAKLDSSKDNNEKKKEGIVDRVLSVITGSIAPMIPLLAGAGMGKVLLLILSLLGILDKSSQTFIILKFILIQVSTLCQYLWRFQQQKYLNVISI